MKYSVSEASTSSLHKICFDKNYATFLNLPCVIISYWNICRSNNTVNNLISMKFSMCPTYKSPLFESIVPDIIVIIASKTFGIQCIFTQKTTLTIYFSFSRNNLNYSSVGQFVRSCFCKNPVAPRNKKCINYWCIFSDIVFRIVITKYLNLEFFFCKKYYFLAIRIIF